MHSTYTLDVSALRMSELESLVGGLSEPSKMPGLAYSLPALECITGTKLRAVKGSTCHGCYAMKGRYAFPGTRNAQYRRLATITRPDWVPAMTELITRKAKNATVRDCSFFRWHDAGDLQSTEHLARIVEVAERTPHVSHWLPTREYRIVQAYVASRGPDYVFPANLNVRLSAPMIGGHVPTFPRLVAAGCTLSSVSDGKRPEGAYACPAPTQEGKCGDCRACWDRSVPLSDYHLH